MLPIPYPIGVHPIEPLLGPIASLQQCADALEEQAAQAAAIAREAAADAVEISSAHAFIVAQHRKILQKAFGINPDGSRITDPALLPDKSKKYKSVKTVKQYNDIVRIVSSWGDDAVLADSLPDDVEAAKIRYFHRKNPRGYNYTKYFEVEETKGLDGSPMILLKHKNSGGIVLHMLDIFDVIAEAHSRQGHLKVEKTLANCMPTFYSPTYKLCKIFCDDCFVCHEKQPIVPARKGAKKPIMLLEF